MTTKNDKSVIYDIINSRDNILNMLHIERV